MEKFSTEKQIQIISWIIILVSAFGLVAMVLSGFSYFDLGAIFSLVGAVGALKLKEWGRKFIIFFYLSSVIITLLKLFLGGASFLLTLMLVLPVIVLALIPIWFFTRKSVKFLYEQNDQLLMRHNSKVFKRLVLAFILTIVCSMLFVFLRHKFRYDSRYDPTKQLVATSNFTKIEMYIESWDRIHFYQDESRMLSQDNAEEFLKTKVKRSDTIDVVLGKSLAINEKGLDSEVNEIQDWLVALGYNKITFKLATSNRSMPIVRKYTDGEIR